MARKKKKNNTINTITSSITGSINDITNLKFYTGKGYEIPMQKSYVLTWEFIPGDLASKYIKTTLKGYFIGDIDFTDYPELKIGKGTLKTGFIDSGSIYLRFATISGTDENGMQIFSYDDIDSSTGLLSSDKYYDFIEKLLVAQTDNKVKISINIKNQEFTHIFDFNEIFELNGDASTYQNYTDITTVYIGSNIGENKEFYQSIGVSKIDLVPYDISDPTYSYIQYIFENNVNNLGIYFPFVRYIGDFYQEKVSTEFIAADTILVLEEVKKSDGTFEYVTPYINADSQYSLVFKPSESSNDELKIIDSASEYNILYKDNVAFALASAQPQSEKYAKPFSFAIAFQAKEEGAYQNLLGIYLKSYDEQDLGKETLFFLGAINVKSEVEDEDERFRTLLTNFGVPDPIHYSNLFAEQDYQEEGQDYKLVNKKSKELMLTYDQIFSYVGTYKALIRAIKYLGYSDIVFKEWYTIKDTNDQLTDIAVQVFDSSNGNFLKQKLADFGISIEDFNNYNKLNRISMIYHLNQRTDEVEKIKTTLAKYDPSEGKIVSVPTNVRYFTFLSEVPMTAPLFIYRNEETLAKLYAVKRWLEQHIIGVGAYISDITGEGIYFGWQKTQGYQTQHHLNDFSQEQYYTPDVKQISEFTDSSCVISCTLNELNNAVRFIDYDNTPINAFTKYEIPINLHTDDGTYINSSVLAISNPIEAPVIGDEFEFDLTVKPDSGSLYEWTSKDSSAQILIQDGEIKFLFDENTEVSIDSSCLPIITLENANIHKTYGNWRSNIKWMIRETIDDETGNTNYTLKNYQQYLIDSNEKINNQYIIIEPDSSLASITYTENNKWDIPMFIIKGYKFSNMNIDIDEHDYYNLEDTEHEYILEILKGDMLFKDINGCSCQVSFSNDNLSQTRNGNYINEQQIQPIYKFGSERKPIVNLNSSLIQVESDSIVNCSTKDDISTNIIPDIQITYDNITENIRNWNNLITYHNNPALDDASNFDIYNDASGLIDKLYNNAQQSVMNSSLEQIINDNYIFNKIIDISVNRLGNYELTVKAFDKYNNIFTAKYDNNINVIAPSIPIDTISDNDRSNNETDFYQYNNDGSLLAINESNSLINDISLNNKNILKFPKSYHISDIDYDLENKFVEFDNISYVIDTPKNNDTVIFDTLNERCIEAKRSDSSLLKLSMLDENPNKLHLYSDISNLSINKTIGVFVYDPLLKDIIDSIENCQVTEYETVQQDQDINFEADSYIIINKDFDEYNDIVNKINDKKYKTYVLNITEYPVINSSFITYELDYDNKQTSITYNCEQIFNPEDVVKIRYYYDVSVLNTSSMLNAQNEESGINEHFGEIINETSYRIIKVNEKFDEDDNLIGYEYILNGLPNTTLLNDPNVHAVLMYAAQRPVKYTTNIIGHGGEFNQIIGYDNYSIIRDHFNFNTSKTFLYDYIDDTYGIEINDYDYINGYKYWFDFTQYTPQDASNMNLYYYHQFPISVLQGDELLFKSHNSNHTLREGFKKEWKVQVMSIDEESETINNKYKETIFRSINDYLTIKPYMLGSHNIQLECTDIFGNRLTNKGEGLIYVKENPNGEFKNYSYV